MLKRALTVRGTSRVLLVDSITLLDAADAGAIVVSASHGGVSSAAFALEHPLAAVFFNDAGVGKDDAGIAALALLDARGVPAGTVAHTSARIGDAQDTWDHGVLSHLNAAALRWGLRAGRPTAAGAGAGLIQARGDQFGLDLRARHHRLPALLLGGDEGSELRRRAAHADGGIGR